MLYTVSLASGGYHVTLEHVAEWGHFPFGPASFSRFRRFQLTTLHPHLRFRCPSSPAWGVAALGWLLNPFSPLHSAARLPGAQRRACPEQGEGAMRSLLRLEVRSWGILPAPEWTHSCQSSGLPVSFPSLPIPRATRFRVNGSHQPLVSRIFVFQ